MREGYPNRNGISYEVLTEIPLIEAIAEEWNGLLAGSSCNQAFSSAQWFIASCRIHQGAQPHVIVARRGEAIAAIFPLVIRDELAACTFAQCESDYNDIVAAPEDLPAITGVLNRALATRGAISALVLSKVRDDSNCLRAIQNLISCGELPLWYHPDSTCPFIRLPGSYDEYLQTRSKSFRTSIRQAHRYADRDNIRITELEPQSFPADRLPDVFLSLHLDRFAEDSPLATPAAQAFVCEVVPSLFVERRLRAFALFQSERIIAIHLCMVGPNSLCLWNGGFRAEAQRWSPGTLLISAGIQEANASKLAEFDFMRGSESYKSRWANGAREIGQFVFPAGQ
jgi:CelD/BcsL family acetyltransferase involved in cellulose biosynthesis